MQQVEGRPKGLLGWLLAEEHPESLGQQWRAAWDCRTPELFQDQGYSREQWERHVTWKRHVPEPLVMLRVLQCNSPVVVWVLLVSACVGIYATLIQPHGWPDVTSHTSFVTPFTLTSFAVSLLMVFRTNSSYARWWEARSACGRMFNHPRIIVRLAAAWIPPEEDHLVHAIGQWAAALNPASFAYICADPGYYSHAADVLTPEELSWLAGTEQAGFAALQVISQLVAASRFLDSIQRAAIEAELSQFDILIGAAERISRQPIPLAYTRHTSRFIIAWLTFLPFAFWPLFGWASLPIMSVLAFLLVGLENIGIQIEEPYRVLPLHRFCVGVKRAVALTLQQRSAAAAVARASAEASKAAQVRWPLAGQPVPLPTGSPQGMSMSMAQEGSSAASRAVVNAKEALPAGGQAMVRLSTWSTEREQPRPRIWQQ